MTHQQYSITSQDLEDTLINALTHLDDSESCKSFEDSITELAVDDASMLKSFDEVIGPLESKKYRILGNLYTYQGYI